MKNTEYTILIVIGICILSVIGGVIGYQLAEIKTMNTQTITPTTITVYKQCEILPETQFMINLIENADRIEMNIEMNFDKGGIKGKVIFYYGDE